MKALKSLVPLLALVFTCWTAGAVSISEGPVYNPATGHNYYLLSPDIWSNAEAFSVTLGGHLVTINDAAEDLWIHQTFLVPHPSINPYIGLVNPDFPGGSWSWISGEPATYLNWGAGEPNFAHEHYANLFEQTSPNAGKWNNTWEIDTLFAIAEVPEPSAVSLAAIGLLAFALKRARRR